MLHAWNRWRPWHKVALIVFVVVIISTSVIIGVLWYKLKGTADAMYEPLPDYKPSYTRLEQLDTSDLQEQPVIHEMKEEQVVSMLLHPNLKQNDPFTLLILGVDERERDRGRSDSMALAVVNPVASKVTIVNIPRDTRTTIVGKGTVDKINHAYAFGGIAMSVATVEDLFDIPVHYYVKTNMEGFKQMIDAVGGVKVNNQLAFTTEVASFAIGEQTLNGDEALAYVRMRKQDPNGDFGRMDRQRMVLTSLLKQTASVQGIAHWNELLDHMSQYMKTNLTFNDLQRLLLNYIPSLHQVDKVAVNGRSEMIDHIYYWQVDEAERLRIHNQLLALMNAS